MNNLLNIINKYNLNIYKIINKKRYYILEGINKKYLLKEKDSIKKDIFNIFEEIRYEYYQPLLNSYEDSYELYPYYPNKINDINFRLKVLMQALISLQLKTVYTDELLESDLEEIYNTNLDKIHYLMGYYLDIQDYIEEFEFPKLDYYFLLLNISKIHKILRIAKDRLNIWYQDKIKRVRKSIIIKDISLSNFQVGEKCYFIDFKNYKKDLIVYDLVSFYKNNWNNTDTFNLLELYWKNIMYSKEEMNLFLFMICIPNKITFQNSSYKNIIVIENNISYIDKTIEVVKKILEKDKEEKETDK